MKFAILLLPALAVAACSPAAEAPSDPSGEGATSVATPPTAASPSAATAPSTADPQLLSLEGLGALRIGERIPDKSGWKQRGAQVDPTGGCGTVTSPDYPGVYALTEDGVVRRITLGENSTVKLAEGIGVGATEKQVRQWFGGFREEPHKYIEGGKYLTAPNAPSGDSALRFEIGRDGIVDLIHVGTMPQLAYVEGCA